MDQRGLDLILPRLDLSDHLSRLDDRDVVEAAECQQIVIARDDEIGMCGECASKEGPCSICFWAARQSCTL